MLRRSSLVECVTQNMFTKCQIFFHCQYVQPCLSKNPKYTFYTIKSSLALAYYRREILPLTCWGKKRGGGTIHCSSTINFTKQLTFTLSGENEFTLILFPFWITSAGEEMPGCGKILRGEVTGFFTFLVVCERIIGRFFVGVTEGSCGPTFPPTSSVAAGNGWETAVSFDLNVIIKAFFSAVKESKRWARSYSIFFNLFNFVKHTYDVISWNFIIWMRNVSNDSTQCVENRKRVPKNCSSVFFLVVTRGKSCKSRPFLFCWHFSYRTCAFCKARSDWLQLPLAALHINRQRVTLKIRLTMPRGRWVERIVTLG